VESSLEGKGGEGGLNRFVAWVARYEAWGIRIGLGGMRLCTIVFGAGMGCRSMLHFCIATTGSYAYVVIIASEACKVIYEMSFLGHYPQAKCAVNPHS